jgi:hypothetical protein
MSSIEIEKYINLSEIFINLENQKYCIIKLPDIFPDYDIGSDLDIFCYDIHKVAQIILSNLQKFIKKDLEIKTIDNGSQIYIDVIKNNSIHFRFDLYGALPFYKNINIKSAFFSSVIEGSELISMNGFRVKTPCAIDEAVLRYIEYHEWYAERPDKIKHIKYLEDKITSDNLDVEKLLDKLHYYTLLPKVRDSEKSLRNKSVTFIFDMRDTAKKILQSIKSSGLKFTFFKIMEKIKK